MSLRRELADRLKLYGHNGDIELVRLVQAVIWDDLREEFTEQVTDLPRDAEINDIVDAFDRAVQNLKGKK